METSSDPSLGRRAFLGAAVAAGVVLAGCNAPGERGLAEGEGDAEVTPGEDLMQEHGVLDRLLLVQEEAARRIEARQAFGLEGVTRAAGIVRRFVHDYHEKLEEEFVFPRVRDVGLNVDLVVVLLHQHERGRALTDEILRHAAAEERSDLAQALRRFSRMYRPHAAREETVLFQTFRQVVGRDAYRELGDRFEAREHELLGASGFEETVAEVARLEADFGIGELASFTP
jgi:hemerythrin-like domain-containing protein